MELRSGKVIGRKPPSIDVTVKHWLPLEQQQSVWDQFYSDMKKVGGEWYAVDHGIGRKPNRDCQLGTTQAYELPLLSNDQAHKLARRLAKKSEFCKINVFYYCAGSDEAKLTRIK